MCVCVCVLHMPMEVSHATLPHDDSGSVQAVHQGLRTAPHRAPTTLDCLGRRHRLLVVQMYVCVCMCMTVVGSFLRWWWWWCVCGTRAHKASLAVVVNGFTERLPRACPVREPTARRLRRVLVLVQWLQGCVVCMRVCAGVCVCVCVCVCVTMALHRHHGLRWRCRGVIRDQDTTGWIPWVAPCTRGRST